MVGSSVSEERRVPRTEKPTWRRWARPGDVDGRDLPPDVPSFSYCGSFSNILKVCFFDANTGRYHGPRTADAAPAVCGHSRSPFWAQALGLLPSAPLLRGRTYPPGVFSATQPSHWRWKTAWAQCKNPSPASAYGDVPDQCAPPPERVLMLPLGPADRSCAADVAANRALRTHRGRSRSSRVGDGKPVRFSSVLATGLRSDP